MAPKKGEKKKSVVEEEEEEEVEEVPHPPPPPPPPGPGFYSVWAEPPNVMGMNYDPTLHLVLAQLREQHESAPFSPHVTVMGHYWSEFEAAEANLRALCDATLPFTLRVKAVETGETYFQCVYLLMDKSDEVVDAHVQALTCFNRLNEHNNLEEIRENYKPHMSLMYCHMTDEELHLAKAKVEAEHGKELLGREYSITHLSLWLTDVGDESCLSWRRVAEFPLKDFEKPKWALGQEKPPPPPPEPEAEEGDGEEEEEEVKKK